MEQRIKNLEDLCELITKEVVDQNKNMIEMNKNLINEIRNLREAYVKQDEDFEEFKNLLRKIYELNRQNFVPPMFPPNMPPMNQPPQFPPNMPGAMNNSLLLDQINQSMVNNLSFQSVQNQPPNFPNLNQTIPSSASAMMKQLPPDFSQPPPQVKPTANVPASPFNQAPPTLPMFPQSQPKPIQTTAQPPQQVLPPQQTAPFKFAPNTTTTSTPQPNQFTLKTTPQPQVQPQADKAKPPVFDFSPSKPTEQKAVPTQVAKPPLFAPQTAASTPKSPASTQSPATSIFAGANLFKTTEPPKPSTQPLFGLVQPPTNLFGLPPTTATGTPGLGTSLTGAKTGEDGEEEGAGNPEEYEPQVDFKPIVQLKEVEVKTGEEDEDVLLKKRCKLYRFDRDTKEWKEKGLGELKLLKHKQTKVIRVLMRREQVLKLCANHRVNGEMKLNEISPKQLSWLAMDFSENEAKSELLLCKFGTVEDAAQFKVEFEKAVKEMKILDESKSPSKPAPKPVTTSDKPSLSQTLKSDNWNCTGCYAPNKKDDLKCACCSALKPGVTEAEIKSKEPAKPSNAFSFGTGTGQFSFGTQPQQQQTTKLDFSAKENIIKTTTPATNLFGSSQPALFEKSSMPSFGGLAASAKSGSVFGNVDSGASTTSIFKPLGFGGGIPPSTEPPKQLFGTPSKAAEDNEEDGGENHNPEEYEPQVEFKPLVKLQEVEVKTGEENEEAMFKQRCKLFRYDSNLKEWKEKGTGEIKVLKHKTNENMYRILMRRDQVLKLCANHRVTSDLKLEIFNEKQVRWYAQDYSEGEGKHELLAVRFKSEEDAKKFKQVVEDCQKGIAATETSEKKPEQKTEVKNPCEGLKPSLSSMFKKEGWTCTGCYVLNKEQDVKCVACQTVRKDENGKPVEQKLTSQPTPAVTNTQTEAPKFSFGTSGNQTQAPISFGQTFGQKPTTNLFGAKTEENKTPENVFGTKAGPSFADLAKTTSGFGGGFTGGFGSQATQAQSLFGAKPAPLFGAPKNAEDNEEDGGENHNPEEYEPQVEFKPLVKLQEVEVKSGEEDEEILFKQRCKLYRFDSKTKEWKEKGTGEIKILKHRMKENSFRVLMRRDQVLKICANHRISPDIKLETLNEKQLRYLVNDCSEGEPQTELLAVKFRSEEDTKKFREEFEKCQNLAKNYTGQKLPSAQPSQSVTNNLASSIKTEQGSWNCSGCLTLNKPNAVKCACCNTEKPSKEETNGPKDIEVVFTAKPSDEEVEKARSFGLPDSFYLYQNKPNCKGCIGCEKE